MSNFDSDSSFRLYMLEISKIELLTPKEEVELARRIQLGDEEARSEMIRANLRLVVKIAKEYSNYGVPVADLISEGNIGLMKAVERFEPKKGGKLSTYASWWIKQSIKRALANQGKTIRLPVHLIDKLAKVRRITELLTEELGREPSVEELSEILGIPRKKLVMLQQASLRPTSLDAPLGEDVGGTLGETIADVRAEDPLDALELRNDMGDLEELLELLDSRESKIIAARFGLGGMKPMTLEAIGRDFGITRERIRQLQNTALGKMRRALTKKDSRPLLAS